MKKVFVLVFLSVCMTIGIFHFLLDDNVAEAASITDAEQIQKFLANKSGDWYNSDGKLILSIHDNSINDCEVVGIEPVGGNINGLGTFIVKEKKA